VCVCVYKGSIILSGAKVRDVGESAFQTRVQLIRLVCVGGCTYIYICLYIYIIYIYIYIHVCVCIHIHIHISI